MLSRKEFFSEVGLRWRAVTYTFKDVLSLYFCNAPMYEVSTRCFDDNLWWDINALDPFVIDMALKPKSTESCRSYLQRKYLNSRVWGS